MKLGFISLLGEIFKVSGISNLFIFCLGSSYAQIKSGDVASTYTDDACMICEYTGVAETEAYAHQVLAGKEASTSRNDANGLTPKLPFVLHTAGGAYVDSATQDYYNYAPVTIL